MTTFTVLGALLVAAALLFVVPPLLRGRTRTSATRDSVNVAVYRDQLRELDSDLRNGSLAQDQFEKAKREIEARLAADLDKSGTAPASAPRGTRAAAAVLGIAVPIAAIGVYLAVGNPRALNPDLSSAASPHGVSAQQFEALTDRLAARLKEHPEDPEGWAMLGRSYSVLGRFPEAANAYANAAARSPNDAQLLADYADALAMVQGRRLEGEPEKLIERALAADPANLKALLLAGTVAFNKGNYAGAVGHWERALGTLPTESEMAQQVQGSIAEARQLGKLPQAAGKSPAAVARSGSVSGVARLSPKLAGKVAPTDTVFVYARAAAGPRMPLAVLRKQARDLPIRFVLDDSMAMTPQMRLSGFSQVVVGARVSKSASATPQPGDLEGVSSPVKVGAKGIAVTIDTEVR